MNKIRILFKKCKESDSSVSLVALRYLYYKLMGKNILANNKVIIKGLKNIQTNGLLEIGTSYMGLMHKNDITYLNIRGKLIFQDMYYIEKGCRFDIGYGATARFGGGYVNAMTNFTIRHGITIGDECVISWGCEFMDEDFHKITYPEKIEKHFPIEIGNLVW